MILSPFGRLGSQQRFAFAGYFLSQSPVTIILSGRQLMNHSYDPL